MADNINQSITDLTAALNAATLGLAECCQLKGGVVNPSESDGEVFFGPDQQFPDQETYFDAKCRVANGIYDTVRGLIDWLENNNAEMIIGGFGGITAAISLGLLFAGPVGWAAIAVESTLVSISAWAFSQLFDFEDMQAGFTDVKDELVMALYNASDSVNAKSNFLAVYATATPTPTTAELKLVGYALTSAVLNQLFNPREDVAAYESPSPTDCGAMALQTWSFEASGEGWTFEDVSEGTQSASGQWVSAREAWEIHLIATAGGGGQAQGRIYLDSLAIGVEIGNSVQADYSITSDELNVFILLVVTYSDLTTDSAWSSGSHPGPGTVIMDVAATKTVEEISVRASREIGNYNFTVDITEVRVQ